MAAPTATDPLNNPSHSLLHNRDIDVRFFGNTEQAIRDALSVAWSGATIKIPAKSGGWSITSPIIIGTPVTIEGDGALLSWASAAPGGGGLVVGSSNVHLRGLQLTGRNTGTYVSSEQAVRAVGSSWASALTDVTVEDCVINGWGESGVYMQYITDFRILRNRIYNIAYAGNLLLSSQRGVVANNVITNITPGNGSSNAYGIALTRSSTSSLVTDPRSSDIAVTGNTISGVPAWEGIDTHGGERLSIVGNTVYNVLYGIQIGDARDGSGVSSYGPKNVLVAGNLIKSSVTDGSRSSAIILYGAGSGATVADAGTGAIIGNVIEYCGQDRAAGNVNGSIDVRRTEGVTVSGNTITNSSNVGILLFDTNTGFTVSGNTITDVWTDLGTNAWGIYTDGSSTQTGYIGGNAFIRGSLAGKTHVLTKGIQVGNSASSAVAIGPHRSDATTFLTDAGNKTATSDSGPVRTWGSSAVNPVEAWVTGESTYRLAVNNTGDLLWTDGSATSDTNLKRSGAATLLSRTDWNGLTSIQLQNSPALGNTSAGVHLEVVANQCSGYLGAFPSDYSAGLGALAQDKVVVGANSVATAILLAATGASQYVEVAAGSTTAVRMLTGTGSPEGVVTASAPAIYYSTDGNIYRKGSGSGNTGWVAM